MTTLYFAVPGDLNTLTGGYGYDRRLIQELRQIGCTVTLLTFAASFPEPDAAALADAEAQLAALPDQALVMVDGLAFGAMADIAERQCHRLRLMALCHHPLMLETGLSPAQVQQRQQSEQRALQAVVAIVVTSTATATTLTDLFGVPASRISVALPGTDPQPFAPADNAIPLLLTVASLTRRKAHDVLIDALFQLQDLPWRARWVGGDRFDPDWAQQLWQRIAERGLENRIQWAGEIENTAPEYACADLFVLPSRYEGYGMVFAEALAFGVPVVATRAGAIPDVVPETAGVLVPPDDSAALAQSLRRLLLDTDLRRLLRQGARDHAQQLPRWRGAAAVVAALIAQFTASFTSSSST